MPLLPPAPDARAVLAFYSLPAQASVQHLHNLAGFSGAGIYRVKIPGYAYCLKAWPRAELAENELDWMHGLMRRARGHGLEFVPAILETTRERTWIRHGGWLWDLTTWLPGRADYHSRPTPERLRAAVQAIARIHEAWLKPNREPLPCASIIRRESALADWNALLRSGWRLNPEQIAEPAWRPLLARAWDLAIRHMPQMPALLAPWRNKVLPCQPCLGDVWHDHILFEGDRVSGVIDFGGVRVDHVAVDLGRLVGSLASDDETSWTEATSAYRALRPLSWEEEALARLLDRTGAIIAILNWLRWCGHGERSFAAGTPVTERLTALVERVEGWA